MFLGNGSRQVPDGFASMEEPWGRDPSGSQRASVPEPKRPTGFWLLDRSRAQGYIDVPLDRTRKGRSGEVCVGVQLGRMWVGGYAGLQGNDVPPTVDGDPIANRVGLWFMPPKANEQALSSKHPRSRVALRYFGRQS